MGMSKQARMGLDNMKNASPGPDDKFVPHQEGGKGGKGARTVTSMAMKKVGRNLARAANQRGR